MANEEKNKSAWLKVIKLFLEFLIAALVAFFGASCVRAACRPGAPLHTAHIEYRARLAKTKFVHSKTYDFMKRSRKLIVLKRGGTRM